MKTVYLDNNATTALVPEAFEAMRPFHTEVYGNPSSGHREGARPAAALRQARRTVARFLGCEDGEIVFTGSGTEADNLAIYGVVEGEARKRHFVTTAVEHPAVLKPLERLAAMGHEITVLGVDRDGALDLDELRAAIRDDTALVTVMMANNETGVLFPIAEVAAIARERGLPFHTDAVQALGKVPFDMSEIGADMTALSAHKFHGPKGVGALVLRGRAPFRPLLLGGSQERGYRPGTENVAGIAALAAACAYAEEHLDGYGTRVRALRDRFEQGILSAVPDTYAHGAARERLPNTSNVCFRGVDAQAMLLLLDEVGICATAGSACKSGAGIPSPVLDAMGVPREEAAASVRFSLSGMTTDDEIDYALGRIPSIVASTRERV
jgi:cysteine desulfurase